MRLKQVVLPAPLGPMRATVCPSSTETENSWTARRPPNRLLRPRTTRASLIGGRRMPRSRGGAGDAGGVPDKAFVGARERPQQAGGLPQDDGDQDDRVKGQLHPGMPAAADRKSVV